MALLKLQLLFNPSLLNSLPLLGKEATSCVINNKKIMKFSIILAVDEKN